MLASFDYIVKSLIVLSETSGGVLALLQVLSKLLCKFYSCIFFDNRNNKESVSNNKKQKEET